MNLTLYSQSLKRVSFDLMRSYSTMSDWMNYFRKESRLSISRLKTPPTSRLRCISLSSDDDDFTVEEIPPSAKRSKLSPAQDLTDESSSDRPNSPILSGPKRTKRPIQLSISKFVEVLLDDPIRLDK